MEVLSYDKIEYIYRTISPNQKHDHGSRITHYALYFLISILLLSSCQKEEVSLNNFRIDYPEPTPKEVDEFLHKISLIFKDLSKNESFVEGIKTLAATSKKEKSILLVPNLDFKFFHQGEEVTLETYLQPDQQLSNRSGTGLIDELLSIAPTTQITLYSPEGRDPSLWGTTSIPSVGYHSLQDPDFVKVFKSDEEYENISYFKSPQDEFLVVNHSEQLVSTNQIESSALSVYVLDQIDLLFSANGIDYYLESAYQDARNNAVIYALRNGSGPFGPFGPDGPDGPPLGPRSGDCDRDKNELKDRLTKFKFASEVEYKNAKDGWFNDYLEMRVDIVFAKANGTIGSLVKTFSVDQKDVKNLEWHALDLEILRWNPDEYGSAMKYLWSEKDLGSGTSTTTIVIESKDSNGNTTTITQEYTRPKNIYDLSESLVEYCDAVNNGEEYNTGKLLFEIDLD